MASLQWMPAPTVGDIVWCIVPYVDSQGRTSDTRHPALVMAVDNESKSIEIVVVGGASARSKYPKRASDLLIQTSDPWFNESGLHNDTVFHMARRYTLPYTADHFVIGVSGTPKIGLLNPKYSDLVSKMRKALVAAQTI